MKGASALLATESDADTKKKKNATTATSKVVVAGFAIGFPHPT
uniref:Translocon-associated protein subunit beta n=1 Tax=Rhizophora mucronata TaxID=61149 RepID=A0A2P2LB87_RHIMU